MYSKKEILKNNSKLINLEELQYINQKITGEIITKIKEKTVTTRYIKKKVNMRKLITLKE